MKSKLEVKEYQEKVAELQSTVEKLRRDLKSLRESGSDAGGSTLSENESSTVGDTHSVVDQGTQQHAEVHCAAFFYHLCDLVTMHLVICLFYFAVNCFAVAVLYM